MLKQITNPITKLLRSAGVTGEINLVIPPNPAMGDVSFACFELAKEWKMPPADAAKKVVEKIGKLGNKEIIERVGAVGPYLNFYFDSQKIAHVVMIEMERKGKDYGKAELGKGKKIMVEFAHPNTHKAFHIGHLRNIVTGESVVRIFENAGYEVVRANYQGDVGMHIAKFLYGIKTASYKLADAHTLSVAEKATLLGKFYAQGAQAFEKNEKAKEEIIELNDKIYSRALEIMDVYQKTRQWSLEYFDYIYKRVDSHFDRLYFESECFERGAELVRKFLEKGIFKKSDGAIIFEGSKYGLHDRVFINSKGFPTYEAKDMALAELQFGEHHPDAIYHIVAKEQTEYFRVIIKALEFVIPESKDKEFHLPYGWVSLKSGKMSSRTGKVVLGEWLLDKVEKKIAEVMKDSKAEDKAEIIKKVAMAAVKYSFLKNGISNDLIFDLEESIRLTGDSGPYLLYVVARIKSILNKSQIPATKFQTSDAQKLSIEPAEKKLLLTIASFPEITKASACRNDPSIIAKYLLELAKNFTTFYRDCPVLHAEGKTKEFRLYLISIVLKIMEKGLGLLGIQIVREM